MDDTLYKLPSGTLLVCVSPDTTDEGYKIDEGDISLIIGQETENGLRTRFLSLTQGMLYTCHYGRQSPYARMCCYEVYKP